MASRWLGTERLVTVTAWPYILLLLLSAALSAVLAVLAWQRRPVPGAASACWLLWALCEWCVAYALALGSQDVWWASFWSRLRFAGIAAVPVAWLSLTLSYTGRPGPMSVRSLTLLLIVPAITQLLTWDSRSALMFEGLVLEAPPPFYGVEFRPGLWFWVHTAYGYVLLLVGVVVLMSWLARTKEQYYGQALPLAIAALVPWAGNIVTQLGIAPNPYLDLTPFCFVLSAVAVFVAMFRYRFLNLAPIARDAVLEGMRDGVIVVDWMDRIVDLNPAARQIVGARGQGMVGRLVGEVLPVWEQLASKASFLPKAQVQWSTRVGGAQRDFAVDVSPLQERPARLQGRLVVLHDITDLRASQESVRRSEQRYRALFEASNDAIFVTAVDGRVVDCNQSAGRLYRSTRERLIGLPIVDLIRPATDGDALGKDSGLAGGGEPVPAWGVRRDGDCFPAEVDRQPAKVGDEPCTVVFVRDVTERKRVESQWERENTLLRSIAGNSPLAFYVVDGRDDRVLYMNQRFCDLWGLPPTDADPEGAETPTGETIGAALQRQVADPGSFGELWARLRGEIPRTVVEQDLALADGRTLRWFSTQVRDGQGRYFGRLHIFEDNSDRKRAEDTQRLAAVGQLAAGVAHEFNNILCSMRLRADLARLRRTPNEYEELVRVVVEGAEKGAQICDDMLSFARPAPPQRVSTPVEQPLEAALSLAGRRLTAGPITVRKEYHTAGWLVSIDPGQIEHVFLNLILNACDAMPEGGTLSLKTWFDPLAGGQVVVEVSDTGCGIRREDLPRIFEPFFTTRGLLGTSELPASGLGLAVSHGLLQAHHATISVRSEWGQGTTFEVRFGAHERRSESRTEAESAPAAPLTTSPARVLVVEDEDEVRATIEAALQSEGYQVVTVASAPEAKSLLETGTFDLVVTDMLMPGGNGKTVVQAARQSAGNPPVVVITGKPDPALEQELGLAGVARVVAKPFGLSDLLAAVRAVGLRRRRQS